jgi:outer membrane protein
MSRVKRMATAAVALLIGAAGTARGQDTLRLDLARSVETSLKQNPEIRIAEKELSKTKAGIAESVAALLPRVTGSVNFQHAWEIQESVIPNFIKAAMRLPDGTYALPGAGDMPDYLKLSFGVDNTFLYGATLTQPVFLGGAGLAGVRIASGAKHAAEGGLEAKKQAIVYNTVGAFYACLLAREVAAVQGQALEQTEANLDLVRKRYDAGNASGFDKMRAEVDVANLRPQVISAQNGYLSALTGLRMVMGLPESTPIVLEGELGYAGDTMDSLSLADLRMLARRNRPEYLALNGQKSIASGAAAAARSSFLPKVFFQTDYSFMAMRTDYKFTQDDFSKGFTSAVSLQIPLFNSGVNWYGWHKARMDVKIAKDNWKQADNGIAAETEMTFNNYREARQKVRAAGESVAMAEEAMRLAVLMYEEGASTQLDVMGARLALTQSRLNSISSLYEYQMARYGLRKAAGILQGVLQ